MAHANARLTEFGRLLLVQRVTELGWPVPVAAEALGVSRATCYKWLGRWRSDGPEGLADRSSRPRHRPHALGAGSSSASWPPEMSSAKAPTSWPVTSAWPAPRSRGGASPPWPLPAG
jgi:hypothetical protein